MERFGFIHGELDTKILILYVLRQLPSPVDEATLTELCSFDGGVGWFDFKECLASLVSTGHVDKLPGGYYMITDKGRANGEAVESSIPFSVRDKASRLLAPLAARMSRDNMIGASHVSCKAGGVTVTLNEDLTAFDPTMTAGTTMTLHGMQAEYFVRQRYYIGDGSNMGRMERQRQYMAEFAKLAYARLEESADFIGELFDQLKPMLVTNMARGTMINTAWGARDYALAQTRTLEGENDVGPDDHMEFYADEEALRDMVIELFYEPAE